MLAMGLEKELGVPVLVVDKPGASGQLGMTDLAQSKPDGYTVAYCSLPNVAMIYLDPGRKATFQRKDLASVAAHVSDVRAIAVHSREGDLGSRTDEGWIAHHADFMAFEAFRSL